MQRNADIGLFTRPSRFTAGFIEIQSTSRLKWKEPLGLAILSEHILIALKHEKEPLSYLDKGPFWLMEN